MAKIFLEKEEGLALIVSVGILALMALIATSFAINMQLDYKIAANFRDGLKARYLAESGINRAIAELAYGTEGAINTAVDTEGEKWYASEPYKDDTLLDSAGSYVVTKIRDCASQIYINDNNLNLSTILENLVAAIGSPLTAGDGNAIIVNRPAGGYTTKEQIKTVPGFDDSKYNAIKDHITVFAFVDSDVINPKDATTPYAASPRAPINVNTASKEVLIAVLNGISDGTNSISKSEAEELTEYLINGRPYYTYDELWIRLLTAETLPQGTIGDGDAAVVMANANPNTDLIRATPNYSWRYKHVSKGNPADSSGYDANGVPFAVDKTMLAVSTMEFCFNSGGYYEIESTGIIRDKAGAQVAERKLRAIVKIFDIWRQTTQEQFAQGARSYVQLYPEFDYESSTIPQAKYDGQVMLATLEETTPGSGTHFRANFNEDKDDIDNDLNADSAGGNIQRQTMGLGFINPNEASVVGATTGNLLPDGLFFPRDDPETYYWFYPQSNIAAEDGTLEFWFKPNWHHEYADFPTYNAGKLFEAQNKDDWGKASMDIYLGQGISYEREIIWRIHDKNSQESNIKYGLRNADSGNYPWKPGIWHHIAITWDYKDGDVDTSFNQVLYVDGAERNRFTLTDPPLSFAGFQGLQFGCDTAGKEPPNGTMDEIRIFNSEISGTTVATDFARGRYYSASNAYFESSENPTGKAILGTISWTEHTRNTDGTEFISGADIDFDVYDGSNWLGDYENRTNPVGVSLNRLTSGVGNIKYKAYFKNSATTLLDTPVLDDVTITYIKAIEILYWREET